MGRCIFLGVMSVWYINMSESERGHQDDHDDFATTFSLTHARLAAHEGPAAVYSDEADHLGDDPTDPAAHERGETRVRR